MLVSLSLTITKLTFRFHVKKGAIIKGKNILPIREHILSFKSSPNENRKKNIKGH